MTAAIPNFGISDLFLQHSICHQVPYLFLSSLRWPSWPDSLLEMPNAGSSQPRRDLEKLSSHRELTSWMDIYLGFQPYLGEIREENWVGIPQPGRERGVGCQFLMVETMAWCRKLVKGVHESIDLSIALKQQKGQRVLNKTASGSSGKQLFANHPRIANSECWRSRFKGQRGWKWALWTPVLTLCWVNNSEPRGMSWPISNTWDAVAKYSG